MILSSSTGRYNFWHSKHKDYYSKIYPLNMLLINRFLLRNLNHKAWMKTPQQLWNYLSLVIFRLKHEYKCHSVTTNRKFEMSLRQQQQQQQQKKTTGIISRLWQCNINPGEVLCPAVLVKTRVCGGCPVLWAYKTSLRSILFCICLISHTKLLCASLFLVNFFAVAAWLWHRGFLKYRSMKDVNMYG